MNMENRVDVFQLQSLFKKEANVELIMEVLKLCGLDYSMINNISGGLWSRYKKLIGLKLTDYGKKSGKDLAIDKHIR